MKSSACIRASAIAVAAVVIFFIAGCYRPSAMNESTPNVKHITQDQFDAEVTRCTNAVVADFYATWSGPCQVTSPLLDRVAGGYADRIKFVKINVDESPGLAQNFKVDAPPLLIFFKDGKVTERIAGVPVEADLKAKLDALAAGK